MSDAVFTIVANNYLPFARVLMRSFRQLAPEIRRIVILADRLDGSWDPAAEEFEVILSTELAIPSSQWFHFKYTILELSTAVKPYAALHLFDRLSVRRLLYFDPDIRLYRRPDDILAALNQESIVLTPHLTAPVRDARRPGELDILRSGSYNLGFLGLRETPETRRFLHWWQEKLFDHCVVDLAKGLFVDQRWVDLVPGLFDGVGILRDPGLNVAYWNLAEREVRTLDGTFTVNGRPLVFFHFSGFDAENAQPFSKHQDRFTLDTLGDAGALAVAYRQELLECGYSAYRKVRYAFGWFANGTRIPGVARAIHHVDPSLPDRIPDPFSPEGYAAFVALWNRPAEVPDRRSHGLTRLAYRIYQTRADVQAAMPDVFGNDYYRFLRWLVTNGRTEHFLNDDLLAPATRALRGGDAAKGARREGPAVTSEVAQAVLKARSLTAGDQPIDVELLNRRHGNGRTLVLTYLAHAILASRPDLQQAFAEPEERHAAPFLLWFLTHGAREYGLTAELTRPLREQWGTVLRSVGSPVERMRLRSSFLLAGAWLQFGVPAWTGRAKRRQDMGSVGPAMPVEPKSTPVWPAGVNLIGYVRSEMGMGEVVRGAARSAAAAGIAHSVCSVDGAGPYRQQDDSVRATEGAGPFAVDLYCVNADALPEVAGSHAVGRAGRYRIGYWAWELEEFPERWLSSFAYVDEIWTLSGFCQAAIAAKSPVPVVRMPLSVSVEVRDRMNREMFGIPPEPFLFLSVLDLLSIGRRKNPLGLVEAFRQAFQGDEKRHLLLKINHAGQRPEEMREIRAAVHGLPVTIIDRTISRGEVNGLLALSDSVVSLHRSEGFGLTLAEAMYLEKPVIATGYSGNMDFMTPSNSFLTDYDMGAVPAQCDPYEEGQRWAEPRMAHAVEQLRRVAEDGLTRRARAAEGARHIRTHYSAEAVGRKMASRLTCILRGRYSH